MYGMILGNRYEILNKVGEGGMAEVYKARCNKLNRFVAVKILKPEFADNEEIAEKFQREATAVANLSDTNIVNVLDVGNQDDMNFIVMEYVDGRTLKDVIRSVGKIIPGVAIDVAIQVARGLDCAHKNNIIHRDIKPQNILVNEEGHIKVADFGIAKSVGASTITNTTTIMGSAHYLSPEQAKGGYIDCRTDLYSLGIVLYEMVTGELPFDGDSAVTIALKHLQEHVRPPKELNPELSESLNQLILKAVDKDPAYRYQTAKEMILDLQKVKGNPDAPIQGQMDDDQRTVIMAPIDETMLQKQPPSGYDDLGEGYYDEDDYDDEDEYDDYEEDDDYYDNMPKSKAGKKGGNKGLIIGSVIGLILLLCVGGFSAYKFMFGGKDKPKEVTVPNIKFMKVDEAEKALEKVGLKLGKKETQKSSRPEGQIVKTDPAANEIVEEGSTVNIWVSDGKASSQGETLDDLMGMSEKDAKQILNDLGITNISTELVKSEEIEKGCVVETNPAAGTPIDEIDSITLKISSGKENKKKSIPRVVDLAEDAAKQQLNTLGFYNIVVETIESDKAPGVVVKQSPEGGEYEADKEIKLYVSSGKKKIHLGEYIWRDQDLEKAMINLSGAGIKYEIKGDPSAAANPSNYKVASFNPSGEISPDTTVKIYVEKKEGVNPDPNPNPDGGDN